MFLGITLVFARCGIPFLDQKAMFCKKSCHTEIFFQCVVVKFINYLSYFT